MSYPALVAEVLLRHSTGKSVKNRFAQQAVRILSMVIKLGVRKSFTLWLSHTPIRLRIVARVAELLLLEDRHFTGSNNGCHDKFRLKDGAIYELEGLHEPVAR